MHTVFVKTVPAFFSCPACMSVSNSYFPCQVLDGKSNAPGWEASKPNMLLGLNHLSVVLFTLNSILQYFDPCPYPKHDPARNAEKIWPFS